MHPESQGSCATGKSLLLVHISTGQAIICEWWGGRCSETEGKSVSWKILNSSRTTHFFLLKTQKRQQQKLQSLGWFLNMKGLAQISITYLLAGCNLPATKHIRYTWEELTSQHKLLGAMYSFYVCVYIYTFSILQYLDSNSYIPH